MDHPLYIVANDILTTLAGLGPHPLVTIGLAVGAIVAFLTYRSRGSVRDAVIAFIVTSIAAVTPLHVFIILILGAVWTNRWLYERTEDNGLALVLSFPVGIAVFAVLVRLMLVWGLIAMYQPEPASTGSQTGALVGLLFFIAPLYIICAVIGLAGFVLVSTGISVRRWWDSAKMLELAQDGPGDPGNHP